MTKSKWLSLEELIERAPKVKSKHIGNHSYVCDKYQVKLKNLQSGAEMISWIPVPKGIEKGSIITLETTKELWQIIEVYTNVKQQWCDCYTNWI